MPDGAVAAAAAADGVAGLARFLPLLRGIVFLKRVRSAGQAGSLASRLFLDGWAALAGGADVTATAVRMSGVALAAVTLGDLDAERLRLLGAAPGPVLRRALASVADGVVESGFLAAVEHALDAVAAGVAAEAGEPPGFAVALAAQPRAGVTCPGLPRVALAFTESHAEHCLAVAVGGAVLAPAFGAAPGAVFLAGMCHHFHNALMPDSGFAGEEMLGDALPAMMAAARERAAAALPPALRAATLALNDEIAATDTVVARAFHAADVLDRVLEIEACLAASTLSLETVLGPYGLVHAGPAKAFHDRVLAGAGLAVEPARGGLAVQAAAGLA